MNTHLLYAYSFDLHDYSREMYEYLWTLLGRSIFSCLNYGTLLSNTAHDYKFIIAQIKETTQWQYTINAYCKLLIDTKHFRISFSLSIFYSTWHSVATWRIKNAYTNCWILVKNKREVSWMFLFRNSCVSVFCVA